MDMVILSFSAAITVTLLFPTGGLHSREYCSRIESDPSVDTDPALPTRYGVVLEYISGRSAQTSRASTFELWL